MITTLAVVEIGIKLKCKIILKIRIAFRCEKTLYIYTLREGSETFIEYRYFVIPRINKKPAYNLMKFFIPLGILYEIQNNVTVTEPRMTDCL